MKNPVATLGRHLRVMKAGEPPQDWSTLLPCPFCGGAGKLLSNAALEGPASGGNACVVCTSKGCGGGGPCVETHDLALDAIERLAIAKWNRRGNAVGAELKLRRIAQILNSDVEVV